jgi:cytochrome c oxidase assembly protein subunit 15
LRGHAAGVLGGALLTIVAGAFVAGIDAGLAYNTFPLMDGRLVPPGALQLEPWWLNFFENTATVQFTHRLLGVTLAAVVLGLWLRARPMALAPVARRVLHGLAAVAALQVALGIATLLTAVALPLGILHQAGAVALFTLALWAVYELGAAPPAPAGTRRPNSAAPSTKPAQQTSSP